MRDKGKTGCFLVAAIILIVDLPHNYNLHSKKRRFYLYISPFHDKFFSTVGTGVFAWQFHHLVLRLAIWAFHLIAFTGVALKNLLRFLLTFTFHQNPFHPVDHSINIGTEQKRLDFQHWPFKLASVSRFPQWSSVGFHLVRCYLSSKTGSVAK